MPFYREVIFSSQLTRTTGRRNFNNPVDPHNVPLEPVLNVDGKRLVCKVEIGLNSVDFQVWRVNVGRVPF